MRPALKAVIWLHTLRLFRYKWGLVSAVTSSGLWVLMFMLGIILFTPRERVETTAIFTFWFIAAWTMIDIGASRVGGWMNFFLYINMVEEHILRGISPFFVLAGRVVTGAGISSITIALIGALLSGIYGVNLANLRAPALVIAGMLSIFSTSVLYGILIAALAFKTKIPTRSINYLNYMVLGLMMMPLNVLPQSLRLAALFIPYLAPTQLLRMGVYGGSNLLTESVILSIATLCWMLVLAKVLVGVAHREFLRRGTRGVGFT